MCSRPACSSTARHGWCASPRWATLAADVEARGPLPTAEAVALTLEVCEALAEAHARGMAHGDVRTETVLLARDAAGHPIAKLRWTSKAKAERAAREDVARATATDDRTRFRNIGELASAIARFAPPGHSAARNIALTLSRAGIIGGASVRPRAAPRRSAGFAVVSLLLLAATLVGTIGLWRSGRLPQWSGTAPTILTTAPNDPGF